jgi:hypothetical protein
MPDQTPEHRDDNDDVTIPLELHCFIVMEDDDSNAVEFEVIGIVDEEIDGISTPTYAVCYNAEHEAFLVTDIYANPIEEEDLVDLIMEDYQNLSPADLED